MQNKLKANLYVLLFDVDSLLDFSTFIEDVTSPPRYDQMGDISLCFFFSNKKDKDTQKIDKVSAY